MALTPQARKTSAVVAAVVAMAAAHEGVKLTPYYDPPRVLTVCYGETHNVQNRVYSLDECRAMLDMDVQKIVSNVVLCVPRGIPDNVTIAMSDAAYNLGESVVCEPSHSTMAKYLHDGNWEAACNELPKWDKARVAGMMVVLPGLRQRRLDEQKVCLKGLT